MAVVEPHQSLDHQRLWADLLSSEALASTSSAISPADLSARRPRRPCLVARCTRAPSARSASPTRPAGSTRAYLGSLRAFDAAFMLDIGDGTRGASSAIDTKFHERNKPETPKPG